MADININEVYEELKYEGELPETSRLIKDYLALRDEDAKLRVLVGELADALDGFTCKGDCVKYCVIDEDSKDKEECVHIDNRALVAKAREVIA